MQKYVNVYNMKPENKGTQAKMSVKGEENSILLGI